MMKEMHRRISAVEATRMVVPPEIRAWLGDPLTAAEQRELAAGRIVTPTSNPASSLPSSLQAWLDERPKIAKQEK